MAPTATSPESQRGGALDALRFAAAFLIVIYHYGSEGPVELETLHPVFYRGYLATKFFLILSGYVIARAYGDQLRHGALSWGAFLARRLKRIWPAHLVVLGGFVLVLGAAAAVGVAPQDPTHFRPGALAAQALLVQAWGVLPEQRGWNFATWSLSALIVCYAGFPLLWRAQARLRGPWLFAGLALAALIAGDFASHALFERPIYDLPSRMALFRAIPLFVLGVALARVAAERPLPHRAALWAGGGGLAVVIGAQLFGRFDLLGTLCTAAVILAAGSRPVTRKWPLASAGARLSFSLFLTHLLVSTAWYGAAHALEARVDVPMEARWALWWAGLPLALLGAWAFDRWGDQPIQRALKRRRAPAMVGQRTAPAPSST